MRILIVSLCTVCLLVLVITAFKSKPEKKKSGTAATTIERYAMPAAQPQQPHNTLSAPATGYNPMNFYGNAGNDRQLNTFWKERLQNKDKPGEQPPTPEVKQKPPIPAIKVARHPKPRDPKSSKKQRFLNTRKLEIHAVQEGETLWDISRMYTGNGFNYLLLADDNAILNPDLIYPGQQVVVIKNEPTPQTR